MADETKMLISKALSGLIAIVASIGIAIGGFALKNNYESSLTMKELSVRVTSVEANIEDNERSIEKNVIEIHNIQVSNQGYVSDLRSIKSDISEIKTILKEKK